jgi:adenine-specific DNA-methyltransferase
MPTIQFKGKNIIWNHHLSVPYHSLDEVEELNHNVDRGSENLIIEGDNLTALKALLPKYAGKVKCIYIDPPYNTGKEDWVYSDKVNSPLIQEWLNKSVSKEDLTKHDKWLCMMVPRLKLLKELMRKDGIIFVSLDNNEAFNFKQIADEIFGEDNFLGVVVLQTATDNNPTQIATEHEYIFSYASDKEFQSNWSAISEAAEKIQEKYSSLKDELGDDVDTIQSSLREWIKENEESLPKVTHYNYVDNQGVFYPGNPSNTKPGGYTYDIIHPTTKKVCSKPDYGYRWAETTFWAADKKGDVLWGSDESTIPKIKKRLETVKASFKSIIYEDGRSATAELDKLFGKGFFKNPKSPSILKRLFEFTTEEDDIILDSFAGSGTTGQAVLELNKQDGGERQFVLVQMTEESESEPEKNICKDKTRARIAKVIDEYEFKDGFKYLKVGSPIDPETMLEGDLPSYQQFAEYVYYLATGGHLADKTKVDPENHFVGMESGQAVYLIYQQDMDKLSRLALTLQIAEKIVKHSPGKRRVVFAPSCFLDEEYMTAMQIEFVSVPYNLFERKTQG